MPSIQIRVRLGKSSKTFTGNKRLIAIGRSTDNDLVLPFPFLQDNHLVIENTPRCIRVRAGNSEASVIAEGKPVETDWVPIPSPGHLQIPATDGKQMFLDVMSTEPRLSALILRDLDSARGEPDDREDSVQILSQSRFHQSDSMVETPLSTGDADEPRDWREELPWWASRVVAASAVGALYVFLMIGALAFNRMRSAAESRQLADDTQFVSSKIEEANGLIRSRQYAAAKISLDAAETVATRVPQLSASMQEIVKIRGSKEIQLGAAGLVLVGDQWLPEQRANDLKAAREVDDPKIAALERTASEAVAAGKMQDAVSACEQAIEIMKAEAVQPHPRFAAVTQLLQNIKNHAISSEMAAKGYTLYQGRWVKADEKVRLEQEAKGLVLRDGEWMTKEQAAEAKSKEAAGLVFYQGKWITPDQKMQAQGLINFEGKWVKAAERDSVLAQRKVEADAAKAEDAKLVQIKKTAYVRSQDFLRKQAGLPKSALFQDFDSAGVTVVEDHGWFIVQGGVTYTLNGSSKAITKTYYCKLRPKADAAGDWEADATSFAE